MKDLRGAGGEGGVFPLLQRHNVNAQNSDYIGILEGAIDILWIVLNFLHVHFLMMK